jgi:hypothetical protein
VAFVALPYLALNRQFRQGQVHRPKRGQAEQRCQKQQALALGLQVYFETTTRQQLQGPDQ